MRLRWLTFALLCGLMTTAAHGAYDVIIDQTDAVFMNWGTGLISTTGNSSYNNNYRYVINWANAENPAARVRYYLPNIPAGEHLYNIYAWSPSANSNQWHVINVAADGTENNTQQISWGGAFGTNKQWLQFPANSQGNWVQLGPGPQSDATVDNGRAVYISGDHQQPYLWIEYQNYYTARIAFDAIRVVQIPDPPLDGDFNQDGKVDAADYVWWRKYDGNNPDAFDTWRANFGEMNGAGASTSSGAAAVPEPSTVVVLVIGSPWVALLRRFRIPH